MDARQVLRGRGQRTEDLARATERAGSSGPDVGHHQHERGRGEPDRGEEDDAALGDLGVANEHEDDGHEHERERDRVEQPLRDDRSEHVALAGRGDGGEEEGAQHVAASRREHVVPHVADRRQPVGVGPAGVDLGAADDPVPALGARQRGEAVEPERRDQRERVVARTGELRRLLARGPPDDGAERDDRHGDLRGQDAPFHRQGNPFA